MLLTFFFHFNAVQQAPGSAQLVQTGNAAANLGGVQATGTSISSAANGGSSAGSTNSQAAAGPGGFVANVNNQGASQSSPGIVSQQNNPGLLGGIGGIGGGALPLGGGLGGGALPLGGGFGGGLGGGALLGGGLGGLGGSSSLATSPGQATNVQTGNAGANLGGAFATNSQVQNVAGGASTTGGSQAFGQAGLGGFNAGVNSQSNSQSLPGTIQTNQFGGLPFNNGFPIAVGK